MGGPSNRNRAPRPTEVLRPVGWVGTSAGPTGPKPYEFIGFGGIHGPKPYEFIGFGCIHGPKPYKVTSIPKIYPAPGYARDRVHRRLQSTGSGKRPGLFFCAVPVRRCILCYTIVLPGRKSAFRAGFWPACYRESTEMGPPAGPAGGPISGLSR